MTQISYELALSLKDAGFPQTGGLRPISSSHEKTYSALQAAQDEPVFPTLSELIEACGERYLGADDNLFEFMLAFSTGEWFASYNDQEFRSYPGKDGRGKTPEIAVARLWLALNKK